MTQVTAQMVKELRDRTGVGMGKCKQALTDAGGDIEKAIDNLRKAGAASAVKKSGRDTNEGLIGVAESAGGVALIEVNAETDFVVKNERFQKFVQTLATAAAEKTPATLDAFIAEKFPDNQALTIEEARAELIQVLGENIVIKRLHFVDKKPNSSYGTYIHMGGQIVVLVEIAGSNTMQELARDVAMHAAAEAPEYLAASEIPQDVKDREADIASAQIQNKPAEIQAKIIDGKLRAFAEQNCLVSQKFVKDSSSSVEKYVASKGDGLTVGSFLRWQVGN
ncbi:MAG: translation elongation factor Ts [Simkaniaceae bacterium]|nr:translation elongation factor Ts [Simkaniaceae bacterium]